MKAPDILVIIPTYENFGYARNAAWSLMETRPDSTHITADYLIVDDGSEEWDAVDWSKWPATERVHIRFDKNAGLTRSWNAGLELARELGAAYSVCTNSDIVFSPGWDSWLVPAVENGVDLIGPVTNAPGHAIWQNVSSFLHGTPLRLDDAPEHIAAVAAHVSTVRIDPVEAPINGFFMMAKTNMWWKQSFSTHAVFDPAFPLAYNEQELQNRWHTQGRKIAFSPRSYIFHYRSVSRPAGLRGHLGLGAFRPLQQRNQAPPSK
jgi:GT2 family glycosyltransferase